MTAATPAAHPAIALPSVAFGCAGIGGYDYGAVDDRESIAAIHRALDLGIVAFDVADVYGFGRAERVLGAALAGRADHAVVATKVGVRWDDSGRTRRDSSAAYVRTAVDASRRRLGLETIPLLQLHWPDPATPLTETADVLSELIERRAVRHVGVCNFTVEACAELTRLVPAVSYQAPVNAADLASVDAMRAARARGLAVLAYNVLAQGLFSGRYRDAASFRGSDLRARGGYFHPTTLPRMLGVLDRLAAVARRLGRTPAQVAVRWVLDHSPATTALVGVKHAWQAEELAGALGWRLDREDALAICNDSESMAGATGAGAR